MQRAKEHLLTGETVTVGGTRSASVEDTTRGAIDLSFLAEPESEEEIGRLGGSGSRREGDCVSGR